GRSSDAGAAPAVAAGRPAAHRSRGPEESMRTIVWCAAAVLLLGSGAARAQVEEPGTVGTIIPVGDTAWSATAGRTVGFGNSVLQAEVGWPGVSLTYLHGAAERTDYGARVNLNYGFMNTTNNLNGVDFQVPVRYRMTDNPSG